MSVGATASGPRRPPLTHRRILEAALALVDREGADALSMRRLGAELGVAAMSLYNHVARREELLDGLSEALVARIEVGPRDAPPVEVLRRFAHGIRAVALAHPQAFQLVGMRPVHRGDAFRSVEAALAALRALEPTDEQAVHAYRALVSYTRGFALAEIVGFTLEDAAVSLSGAPPAAIDEEAFPHVVDLSPHLANTDRDAAFAYGLEALLAGVMASGR